MVSPVCFEVIRFLFLPNDDPPVGDGSTVFLQRYDPGTIAPLKISLIYEQSVPCDSVEYEQFVCHVIGMCDLLN